MTWHFRKNRPGLEIFPGVSPGGEGWSKTYRTFEEVQAAALLYLRALQKQVRERAPGLEEEDHLLEKLKTREREIRALKLSDLPVELLSVATPDAAYERARHEVELQRLKRRPLFAGGFLVLGLILLLVSLLEG